MTITISIYCHAEPELPLSEAQIVEAPLPGKDVGIGVPSTWFFFASEEEQALRKTKFLDPKNDNYYFNLLSC